MSHSALVKRIAAIEERIALGRRSQNFDLDAFLTSEEKADLRDWVVRYGDVCATAADLHRHMTREERDRWRAMLMRRIAMPA